MCARLGVLARTVLHDFSKGKVSSPRTKKLLAVVVEKITITKSHTSTRTHYEYGVSPAFVFFPVSARALFIRMYIYCTRFRVVGSRSIGQ